MRNKKIIILLILIIILIILFAIICITTDIFRSPKTLFYKYLVEGNMNNIGAITYDEFLNNIQKQEGYDISGNISLKVEGKAEEGIPKLLKNANVDLKYIVQTDGNKNKYISLKENKNSEEAINLELVQNGTIIGIKEKNIYDKYVSLDLSNVKETIEKINEDTADISNATNYEKYILYYISKEDRKTILNTYKNIIDKDISSTKYNKRKVNIEVNGSVHKCNAYKLSITKVELNKLCKDLLNELKNDELTLNLIVEKYNLANLYNKDITKEELLKKIEKMIDELEKSTSGNEKIEITVYESNSKTVRTEIVNAQERVTIDVTRSRSELTALTKVNLKNNKYEILSNFRKKSDNEIESTIIYVKEKTKIKADITTQIIKDKKEILKLNDKNSENLSESTTGKIDEIQEEVEENIKKLIESRTDNEESESEENDREDEETTEKQPEDEGENDNEGNNNEENNNEETENSSNNTINPNNTIQNTVQNPIIANPIG